MVASTLDRKRLHETTQREAEVHGWPSPHPGPMISGCGKTWPAGLSARLSLQRHYVFCIGYSAGGLLFWSTRLQRTMGPGDHRTKGAGTGNLKDKGSVGPNHLGQTFQKKLMARQIVDNCDIRGSCQGYPEDRKTGRSRCTGSLGPKAFIPWVRQGS